MGAVAFADHHDGNLAAISGLISPRARRPRRRKQQAEPAAVEGPRLVEALTG
jgi:hypothetical protein